MDLNAKTVLVVGLARSGVAASLLLARLGARVIANDSKTAQELGDDIAPLFDAPDITLELGRPVGDLFRGCNMMVISPGISINAGFVQKALQSGVEVLGELELAARLAKAPVVAITGTNGKTTTTTLTGMMMKRSGLTTQVVGNIGEPFSAHVGVEEHTDVFVAEVSSFQLETASAFHPRVAAILNLSPDHLDRHGDMGEYLRVKCRIFARQGAEDVTVLNYDDAALRGIAGQVPGKVAWFSRQSEVREGCFVRDGRIIFACDGQEQTIASTEEVRIPGPHNLENSLAAVACALYAGASAKAVRYCLAAFEGLEHRLESVAQIKGIRFINDSKGTNPDAAAKSVQAMGLPTILIAGGYDKQTGFEVLFEALAGSRIAGMVVLGQTAKEIEAGARSAGISDIRHAPDMPSAVKMAYTMAHTGYNVLLSPACASYDMFSDYEERGRVFKCIVNELAKGKQ